jgi:hypothetical protein
MLKYLERDIKSFSLFIEELKKFIEIKERKITKHHFKQIFINYENVRNQGDF